MNILARFIPHPSSLIPYALVRGAPAPEAAGHSPGPHLALERLGERDDLSAAAGVSDHDARRNALHRRHDRGDCGRAVIDSQTRGRSDLVSRAAAEAADTWRLRTGGDVLR